MVENIKKVLALVIEVGNVAEDVIKIPGNEKWMQLGRLLDEAATLAAVEWSQLDDEYEALTDEQRNELVAFAKDKFDLDDEEIERVVEEAISLCVSLGLIVKDAIAIFKKSKQA